MKKYLTFDVGTTCCKCQLFDEDGNILEYISKNCQFKEVDNETYVDILAIKDNIFEMIKEVVKKHTISSICFSSFGESFVSLDKDDNVVVYPMLYTDKRGAEEAKYLSNVFSDEYLFKVTGVTPQAMFSISKLLYIRNNYPEKFKQIDKVLLICDYAGYILTGKRVIDYSLASRTGILDLDTLTYSKDIASKLDIDTNLFSIPMPTCSIVGNITDKVKKEIGIDYDIAVVLGSHDQVCNAVGCGCLNVGDATDGIGTVECITPIFDFKSDDVNMGKEGYPLVPYLRKGLYCTYICNYASNSITGWFKNEIAHDFKDNYDNFYTYMEDKMTDEINNLYCLPYFAGACVPYQNIDAKGAIIGLTTSTKDYEIYKAIIEGLAFEMRFEVENGNKFGIKVNNLVATGGGSLSNKRLQLKANIENINVSTLRSNEGGLCGCACMSAYALKQFDTLLKACNHFVKIKDTFYPNIDIYNKYQEKYEKYKTIYKQIKEIF